MCVCVAERPWVCGMTGNAEGNHLDLCFRAFVELHTFEVGTPPRGRVRETWVTRHLMLHLPRFKGSRGSLPWVVTKKEDEDREEAHVPV